MALCVAGEVKVWCVQTAILKTICIRACLYRSFESSEGAYVNRGTKVGMDRYRYAEIDLAWDGVGCRFRL